MNSIVKQRIGKEETTQAVVKRTMKSKYLKVGVSFITLIIMLTSTISVSNTIYAITYDVESLDSIQQDLYEEEKDIANVSEKETSSDMIRKEESSFSIQSASGGELVTEINENSLVCKYKIINTKKQIAIQKTYIGSKYLYFIQRSGKTLYFSRCLLPSSGTTIDASNASMMTLTNFGHSQVLEYFEYGGVAYFWIGCNASDEIDNLSTGNTYNWSTQIARVPFEAGAEKNYTLFKRLSAVSYADGSGTSIGPVRRVEAALSSNKKYLLIWCRTYQITDVVENSVKVRKRSNYKTRFSIYDADKVNAALTSASANYLSCNSTAIKNAFIASFTYKPGDGSNDTLRYGSNQGLEINNSKQIFIASESRSNGTSQGKFIRKLNSSGNILTTVKIMGSKLGAGSQTELEGLQLLDSKLYFAVKDYNIHYLYHFNDTVFN